MIELITPQIQVNLNSSTYINLPTNFNATHHDIPLRTAQSYTENRFATLTCFLKDRFI